jgi:Uncharacterized protein involved in response to NO
MTVHRAEVAHHAAVRPRFALFAYGFRPFFLAAGLYALIAIAAWIWIYRSGLAPLPATPPQLWHGHEMLFGFIGAAIAGFLLTAVPSWTGARGFGGTPLIVLFAVWLAGRLAFAMAPWIPFALLAVCELALLPLLAGLIAPPLLRQRNRNTPLLAVLAAFWLADAVFLHAVYGADPGRARAALLVGIDLVLLLITVIGGRIVPAFTANALRLQGITVAPRTYKWLDRVAIASMVLLVIADAVPQVPSSWQAFIAAVAALAHAARLSGWQGLRTFSQPIVWSLHLAYAWLPIGLALRAVFLATGAPWAAHWLHALTIGAAALMILAVTTRASLGHTGRPLRVARPIAIAYGLLALAALVRVFLPSVPGIEYVRTVELSALAWLAAFALFVAVYTPILVRPRADGKPG